MDKVSFRMEHWYVNFSLIYFRIQHVHRHAHKPTVIIMTETFNILYIASCIFLIFASANVILASAITILRPFLYYGKVQQRKHATTKKSDDDDEPVITLITEKLTVPKSWFIHFYIMSFAVCLGIAYYKGFNNDLLLILSTIHSIRRIIECYFEHSNPTSRIQLVHYLVGLGFYSTQGIATWDAEKPQNGYHIAFACAMFVTCSIVQNRAHVHLCSLKKYSMPHFKLVASPHYLAEIGIYASYVLLNPHSSLQWLALGWVIINLSASAKQTQAYYRERFSGERQPPYAIIPFLI